MCGCRCLGEVEKGSLVCECGRAGMRRRRKGRWDQPVWVGGGVIAMQTGFSTKKKKKKRKTRKKTRKKRESGSSTTVCVLFLLLCSEIPWLIWVGSGQSDLTGHGQSSTCRS